MRLDQRTSRWNSHNLRPPFSTHTHTHTSIQERAGPTTEDEAPRAQRQSINPYNAHDWQAHCAHNASCLMTSKMPAVPGQCSNEYKLKQYKRPRLPTSALRHPWFCGGWSDRRGVSKRTRLPQCQSSPVDGSRALGLTRIAGRSIWVANSVTRQSFLLSRRGGIRLFLWRSCPSRLDIPPAPCQVEHALSQKASDSCPQTQP